jgi:hypothetical protein
MPQQCRSALTCFKHCRPAFTTHVCNKVGVIEGVTTRMKGNHTASKFFSDESNPQAQDLLLAVTSVIATRSLSSFPLTAASVLSPLQTSNNTLEEHSSKANADTSRVRIAKWTTRAWLWLVGWIYTASDQSYDAVHYHVFTAETSSSSSSTTMPSPPF